MRLFIAFVAVALLTGCATPSNSTTSATQQRQQNNADSRFTQLADNIWQQQVLLNPVSASARDHREFDGQLQDMSPAAVKARYEKQKGWLEQLQAVDVSQLNEQNQINHAMLVYGIKNDVDEYRFNAHYMPLTAEGSFHSSLAFLPSYHPFRDKADYQSYLDRLAAIPTYMEQQTDWLRKAMSEGYTQPAAAMAGFEESIYAYIVQQPEDSVYYRPFQKKPEFIGADEWANLQQQAANVIDDAVMPAYQNYFEFMVTRYLPNARDSVGASELPNGEAFYNNRIKHYTTTDMTAAQIHELGLTEVKRIRAEMDAVIAKTGFDGSFSEFTDFLRNDPQFYPKSADELLRYASFIAKKMDGKLPGLFKTLPRKPYGVAPVPAEIAPKYTTGRYSGSSRDDQAGFYWVNTYALDRRPLYQMEALTLHEAVPGHHLQIALANEMDDLPEYRRSTYISAFGEGWGLYAEYLGIEAGFYQDPYSEFGRLSYEMWRAARLVVDTGMHAMGWSRQQAIDFMASNTALSLHNVTTEIDRYITWPAQALSYKLGELTIKRLRQEAETALGADFDLREFHDAVLKNGSVPLDVLEQQIRQWIKAQTAV
ncbi:DUF885 domain-containing protein [Idiomarina xiamenensis]|uniref:DUF885 domain-containing protein n=1 Tax=Idiomarina xiamenensis 10-D-4 TaxID=740709 RepID=K2KSE5_9GAMM|nr:DUF885 domain-containing protein [Idiomarina xiamenensis]EKE85299.1 hypothetical protein A10D4_03105 [Idiomarina xiamenensis 10-D-4]